MTEIEIRGEVNSAGKCGTGRRGSARRIAVMLPSAFALATVILLLVAHVAAAQAATIATNKPDYAPGEQVTLTGAGWSSGEKVHVEVKELSGVQEAGGEPFKFEAEAEASPVGTFEVKFTLPERVVAEYEVVAKGPTSGEARTTFTDASNIDQCHNGGIGKPPEACQNANWANGNANKNNSHWAEDEFIPYRAVLSDLTEGEHTLVIRFTTVFKETHAIDYLGSFDATETTSATGTSLHANKNNPCLDIFTGLEAGICEPATPASKLEFPSPELKNCDGAKGTVPNPITGSDTGRFMKIWGAAGTTITELKYGPEEAAGGEGKCERSLTVKFTVPSGAKTVVLAWSGHIARGAGFNGWGEGNGASSVSGSPYHMSLVELDKESTGSQDRSMEANAVTPESTIKIIKNAIGGDGTFGYTTTTTEGGGLEPSFNITTSAGKGEKVNAGINPGKYTVTESTLPAEWNFRTLECAAEKGATSATEGKTAKITIPPAGGAVVTCTYTNEKQAKPTIETAAQTPVTVGAKIKDTATLKGLVLADGSGKVTFRLFSDKECKAEVFKSEDPAEGVKGSGEVKVDSGEFSTLKAGTYYWTASFAGDPNNQATATSCADAGEIAVVGAAKAGVATTVKDAEGKAVTIAEPAPLGTAVHDTATLSGKVASISLAEGAEVTYRFYESNNCAGEPKSQQTVAVNADETVPDSQARLPKAGEYSYDAVYSGNANYKEATSACEPFKVSEGKPTVATAVKDSVGNTLDNSHPAAVGTEVHDTATLTGIHDFSLNGTAKVTYLFFINNNCAGTAASEQTVPVNKDETVPDSAAQRLGAGAYSYKAAYLGNADFEPAESACEPFKVNQGTPSLATAQEPGSGLVDSNFKDRATLSGLYGAGGQISWKLYGASDCTGEVASDGPVGVSGNGDYTTPRGVTPTRPGTYYWVAFYGGDADNAAVSSGCASEPITVSEPPPAVKPATAVAPEQVVAGVAAAHGPRQCVATNATIYVSGRQITSVTFYLDGRKLKTLTRHDRKGRYLININARRFRSGVHHVKMIVRFTAASTTKPRTLHVLLIRCRRPPKIKFTG